MKSRFAFLAAASFAVIASAGFANPALAQDETQSTQDTSSDFVDIVVTARKVAEASQSLPITVSAFNSEQLQNRAV